MSTPCPRCEHVNQPNARFCVSCGLRIDQSDAAPAGSTASHGSESAAPKRDPLIGQTIDGRYLVRGVLGEGGMGKVYRAEQKMGNATRNVAIKVLHPDRLANPQLVARFRRECETVIQLHHPNTVQFFDFGEMDNGTLYIVMEHIDGEPLADVIERGPLTAERTEFLLEQICGSLQEAHERGIVHRDLKPDNVLLMNVAGADDFAKVLDFGIAKHSTTEDDTRNLTQQGAIIGTPPYMSPEQFSGDELGPRSDVYSLGVMAYEMLTGRLPFEANTPWEWAAHHLNSEPISIDDHVQGSMIATSRKDAIMRALRKDPAERHGSVADFLEEFRLGPRRSSGAPMHPRQIGESAGGGSVGSASDTRGDMQAAGLARKTPWWAWAVLAIGAVIAAVGAASTLSGGGDARDPAPEEDHVDTIVSAGETATPDEPDTGPSGTDTTPKPAAQDAPQVAAAAPRAPTPSARRVTKPNPKTKTKKPAALASRRTNPSSASSASAKRAAVVHKPTERVDIAREVKKTTAAATAAPSAPDNGDDRSGDAMISEAKRALRKGDVSLAIRHYKSALAKGGPDQSGMSRLKRRLLKSGSNGVGLYIRRDQCKNAQRLYRELNAIGMAGGASRHFDEKKCRKP